MGEKEISRGGQGWVRHTGTVERIGIGAVLLGSDGLNGISVGVWGRSGEGSAMSLGSIVQMP